MSCFDFSCINFVIFFMGLSKEFDNINLKFHKCLKTPTNRASCQSFTPLAASPCKFGTNKVLLWWFSSQRPYQTSHWPRHPIVCARTNGNKRHYSLYNVSPERKRNLRHQTTFPCDDHQKCNHKSTQLKKYFTFEVQVLDDKNVRRRFRASNYQSTTRVKPFICTMPMRLDEGWNQIQFNLSDFTRRAYGSNYIETLRVTIHANCRVRRIYFSDRLYS